MIAWCWWWQVRTCFPTTTWTSLREWELCWSASPKHFRTAGGQRCHAPAAAPHFDSSEGLVSDRAHRQVGWHYVPANSGDYSLRRDAVKWMAEVQTARWVCEENFARGVSPGSATVAHKYAEFVGVLGDAPSTEALLRSADSDSREDGRTLRSWAAGFRARWGMGTNHMACLDAPPVEALGSIARHSGLRYSPRIRLPNESRNPRLDRSFLCPALFLGVQI